MEFADIHIHALYGVDDGAKTKAVMQKMIDRSYSDGVRLLCVTPHFHPGYFGDNIERADWAYQELCNYVQQKYHDMWIFRGNELRYSRECISWLQNGQCRTLNGTRYVLVDFSEMEEARNISEGLDRLLNAGYRPVLAHVERYRSLWGKMKEIRAYHENGILLQMDTQSPLGGFGFWTKQQCKRLLTAGLIDMVGSDAHNLGTRPPEMSECYQYIKKRCGRKKAKDLCFGNVMRLLQNSFEGVLD